MLHVAPIPDNVMSDGRVIAHADQEMRRLETEALDELGTVEVPLAGVPCELAVRFGQPAEEIVKEAEAWGADAIVVTTRACSALSRVIMDSVAERLLRDAPVTVVVIRPARPA
jgi:nucleotide-binding universal stress UspA family protein